MNNQEYWQKRFEQRAEKAFENELQYEEFLKKQYYIALDEIQKELSAFYARFAKNNSISYAEAMKLLSNRELDLLRNKIESYTNEVLSGNTVLKSELDQISARTMVSRYEGLTANINIELDKMRSSEQVSLFEHLKSIYTHSYYETVYEVQKDISIGFSFSALPVQAIEEAVRYPWSGLNFSERIWNNTNKLATVVKQEVTQSFIQGLSLQTTANRIMEQMESSYSDAVRLARTEMAYNAGQATMKGYENSYVNEYTFLATLDYKTSKPCRIQDNKVYKITEAVVGKNYPPLHPYCRSTTKPKVDDSVYIRIARGADGKNYHVPSDMSYEQWWNSLSEDDRGKMQLDLKKEYSQNADKAQQQKYREALGKEVPRSLEKFQELKYNNPEGYKKIKSLYRDVNWQREAQKKRVEQESHAVPFQGEPNSVFDRLVDGKLVQRRYYGKTGKPRLDIDLDNHGNKKQHPIAPHTHEWDHSKEKARDKIGRKLVLSEEIANKDILKGVKRHGYKTE